MQAGGDLYVASGYSCIVDGLKQNLHVQLQNVATKIDHPRPDFVSVTVKETEHYRLESAGSADDFVTTEYKALRCSNEAAVEKCLSVVRNYFGQKHNKRNGGSMPSAAKLRVMPELISYRITRWCSDPYSRGSYTSFVVGSQGSFCNEIAEHESGSRLYFAGEHTNHRFSGAAEDFAFAQLK